MNQSQKSTVYIIIPVHNRKNITLACLENLKTIGDLQKYQVIVVDDGSTDGTSDAIYTVYPTLTVLQGDGTLWWTGAIRKGMQYAIAQGANYLIWLNDDCYPQSGAIAQLLDFCETHSETIVGGQCLDPDTLQPSYGGIISYSGQIQQVSAHQSSSTECDGLAGNFVCISRKVVEQIGYPNSKKFPHYYGDVSYTHTAKCSGYRLLILGSAIGYCKNSHSNTSWLTTQQSYLSLWQERFTIKSSHYWKAELNYYLEFLGFSGYFLYVYDRLIKFFLIGILVIILPHKFRSNLKSSLK